MPPAALTALAQTCSPMRPPATTGPTMPLKLPTWPMTSGLPAVVQAADAAEGFAAEAPLVARGAGDAPPGLLDASVVEAAGALVPLPPTAGGAAATPPPAAVVAAVVAGVVTGTAAVVPPVDADG